MSLLDQAPPRMGGLAHSGCCLFLIALGSLRFLVAEISLVMPAMVHHLLAHPVVLYLHIGLAPVALALLPVQFSHRLRGRRPGLHRWGGRLYALCVLMSGLASLWLAYTTAEGVVAGVWFCAAGGGLAGNNGDGGDRRPATEVHSAPGLDDPFCRPDAGSGDTAALSAHRHDDCGV